MVRRDCLIAIAIKNCWPQKHINNGYPLKHGNNSSPQRRLEKLPEWIIRQGWPSSRSLYRRRSSG